MFCNRYVQTIKKRRRRAGQSYCILDENENITLSFHVNEKTSNWLRNEFLVRTTELNI